MRKPRSEILIAELPNHLILRGNNRRRLFSYPKDYRTFLWHLGRAAEETNCLVHSLCLMTNHVHNLTTPPSVDAASKCIARVAQRYAQLRNAQRNGSGKLFEQRFYSKPVETDDYLLAATLYIEANPIRAGVVTNALDYPWSTYPLHAGCPERSAVPRQLWAPSRWYLSLGHSARERARAYCELFDAYVGQRPIDDDGDRYTRRLLRPNGSRAT